MAAPQKRSEQLAETLRNLVSNSMDIQGVAVISMDGLVIAAELPSDNDQDTARQFHALRCLLSPELEMR